MPKTRGRPFKPGQSGNPAGRPVKANCLTDAHREQAGQPVGKVLVKESLSEEA